LLAALSWGRRARRADPSGSHVNPDGRLSILTITLDRRKARKLRDDMRGLSPGGGVGGYPHNSMVYQTYASLNRAWLRSAAFVWFPPQMLARALSRSRGGCH
jgi:hypothetical protein